MANVIIGIHGLGNKPSKRVLEHWWKRAMMEGLKANHFKPLLPKFELVYWADVLYDKPLMKSVKDANSPYFLNERYKKASRGFKAENHNTRMKVVDFLSRQLNRILLNDDLSLNYSFITDKIVNTYFKDLEKYYSASSNLENGESYKVKDVIQSRLVKIIEKYKNDDIMLISHSMGSIIAFDVLRFVSPKSKINTFITMGSPLGLPVVISKIASEQKQRFNGENQMITPAGIVGKWFNFSDILDEVAFNFKLADDFSENKQGVSPTDFLVVNNYEINGIRNAHKSFGYLRTPEFSKVLNEFNLSEKLTVSQKIVRKTSQIIHSIKTQAAICKERRKNRNLDLF